MKFSLKPTDPSKLESDILIQYCWENEIEALSELPQDFKTYLVEIAKKEDFKGKEDQALLLYPKDYLSSYKYMLLGLGKKADFDIFKLYKSVASSISRTQDSKPVMVSVIIDKFWMEKYSVTGVVKAVVEAVKLGTYKFMKYKGKEEQQKIREIEQVSLAIPAGKISAAEEGVRLGEIFADATIFARNLINEPPEVTSPQFLANSAQVLAEESKGSVKVKIIEKDEAEKLGMNSFLGVSAGSSKPPKFIRLSYKPAGASKKVVLIGKGITFDTGGLSLKTAEHMETMKLDMAGAAAVLGVFKALFMLLPKIEVVGLIAACENMPGGSALKPGDILRAMDGKTIEVLNTDAEGRLTLADAISYANIREKPDEIIDLATLTGACMVALGEEIAGMWGNDKKLLASISQSAQQAGEYIWQMPLFSEYKTLIKSHIADVKNTQTGRYGGAITAALFLSEFVGSTHWVHLDIAGPSYAEKSSPLVDCGGAGFGVRILLEYLSK